MDAPQRFFIAQLWQPPEVLDTPGRRDYKPRARAEVAAVTAEILIVGPADPCHIFAVMRHRVAREMLGDVEKLRVDQSVSVDKNGPIVTTLTCETRGLKFLERDRPLMKSAKR